MKKFTLLAVILISIVSAYSQIPQTISWQGILQDADAKNLSGTYSLTVKLYDVSSGGSALWSETHSNVVIADGLVNLTLGSFMPFSVNFADEYWFEITVDSGTPLPRIKLNSVPYSLHSKMAESANETDPTWSGTANETANIGRSGNVGIGTTAPNALLHTSGSGTGEGNVLFEGQYKPSSPGNPPAEGGGTRMMWYPDKGAFRAGIVESNQWDINNIGVSSISMGSNTIASNYMAVALGSSTVASGYASTSLGSLTFASGNIATAFGSNTIASGITATATGSHTKASGDYSFSMGYETHAKGDFSLAMGKNTTAYSGYEMALGSFNTEYVPINAYGWSENDRLFVIGNGMGDFAPSNAMTVLKSGKVGIGTENPKSLLHIIGTNLSGGNVLFEGNLEATNPSDPPTHTSATRLLWYPSKAAFRAGRATADEWNKNNIGFYSTAIGNNVVASGYGSIAIGDNNTASGQGSVALGSFSTASAFASIALGSESHATGNYAVSLARESIASGAYSTTIGRTTQATGDYSLATGASTTADGDYSTAMGFHSSATGSNSTSIGFWSKAIGNYSTAIGDLARADGTISVAIGPGTRADAYASTAMGHYNIIGGDANNWLETDPLFAIGNGTSEQLRKNALTILKNGNTGIGTFAPSQALDVNGSARLRNHLFDYNNTSGTIGQVLTRGTGGVLWANPVTDPWVENETAIYSTSGKNFGLGINTPSRKLTLAQSGNNCGMNLITSTTGLSQGDGLHLLMEDLIGWLVNFENGPLYLGTNRMARLTIHQAGNVGIQTTTPRQQLSVGDYLDLYSGYVNVPTRPSIRASSNDNLIINAYDTGILYFNLDGGTGETRFYAGAEGAELLRINPDGKVGIGTGTPTQRLDVNGNARFRSIGSGAYSGVVNRTSDGTLTTATSDLRFKENIATLDNSLERVKQLRGVSFTWTSNPEYGTRIGFIAQEFEKVIPELAFTNPTDGYMGINYAEMTAVLVEAMKEQQTIIDEQNKRILDQQNEIDELKLKYEKLFQLLSNK
ncbi:MAG: tail fiber domain-containing protein [Candidatus Kapabacteria bacterium]|nr:tail fiber domain-containing protein [Ignavibacteriota bacterium]MCW5885989.1 tail fiber domain-containing protein [Candidatus Kapabacteria bacterium]